MSQMGVDDRNPLMEVWKNRSRTKTKDCWILQSTKRKKGAKKVLKRKVRRIAEEFERKGTQDVGESEDCGIEAGGKQVA